jgi:hypothetical protein
VKLNHVNKRLFRGVSVTTSFMYSQNRKIGKLNNLMVFGGKRMKGPKQDSQNRQILHVPV